MLFIVEIALLIMGIWALVTAKTPSLIAGPQYQIEGRNARLLGIILVLPLPITFVVSFILALFLGQQVVGIIALLEIFLIVIVLITAMIFIRRVRQPIIRTDEAGNVIESISDIEATIAKKSQGSMIYAILGVLGFTAIIVCPLAFIRAGQAIQLINKHKIGENYRITANLARIFAAIIFVLYGGIATLLLSGILIGI